MQSTVNASEGGSSPLNALQLDTYFSVYKNFDLEIRRTLPILCANVCVHTKGIRIYFFKTFEETIGKCVVLCQRAPKYNNQPHLVYRAIIVYLQV